MSLVEISLAKADGKSLDRTRTRSGHQSNYCGGVRAAAQQRAERNIGNQPNAHCFRQTVLKLFQALFFAARRMRGVLRHVPILTDTDLAFLELQDVTRRQLLNG